jgi:hypothetical protein
MISNLEIFEINNKKSLKIDNSYWIKKIIRVYETLIRINRKWNKIKIKKLYDKQD